MSLLVRKRRMLKTLIVFGAVCLWSREALSQHSVPAIPREAFSNCTFNVTSKVFANLTFAGKRGNAYVCSVLYHPEGFSPLGGMAIDLLIAKSDKADRSGEASGFELDKSKGWKFKGYAFGNSPHNFSELSLKKDEKGNDLTLVGRQISSEKEQQGDVFVFDGISLLRITPLFTVTSKLAFEPSAPKAVVNEVEKQMTEIVESVELSPK